MSTSQSALYVLGLLTLLAVEFLSWALVQLHRETHKHAVSKHLAHPLNIHLEYIGPNANNRVKAGASTRPDWF
jgi:hypothetical protein